MARYFIEVAYKGTRYSGFQVQQNANSVQAEVQKALKIFFREDMLLTGSSRTDAGVHALSNYFHFNAGYIEEAKLKQGAYNLNAILPDDIVIKRLYQVSNEAHCRFHAKSRQYRYIIYQSKDPFNTDRAYYYPYNLDMGALQAAAQLLLQYNDFSSFSKKNTQVKNFKCTLFKSEWISHQGVITYNVEANRFLRGMVKGLVGTMLKVGTGKISLQVFKEIIEGQDSSKTDFSVPPHGLFLINVSF